jgi:hypothetical protein
MIHSAHHLAIETILDYYFYRNLQGVKSVMRNQLASNPNPQRARVLTKAVLNAAEILNINQATLAQVLGVSPSTISRMRSGTYLLDPERKEWELAALVVRLYRALDAITAGDENSLRAWMKNYNADLHDIPANLLISITGLSKTVEYVDAYRARV